MVKVRVLQLRALYGRKSQATNEEAEKAKLAQFMAGKYGASGSRLAAQMGGP